VATSLRWTEDVRRNLSDVVVPSTGMESDTLGIVIGFVGLVVGYSVGGAPTAILAALFGFFLGKVTDSLSKTVD
jgi:tetrahydromethanopterin S-methyltransferase subunit C